MIVIIIIWFYIFSISSIYGLFLFKLLHKILPLDKETLPLFLTSIIGLAFLACFLSIFSLFCRIDLLANSIVVIGAIIIIALNWNSILNYKYSFKTFFQNHALVSVVAVIGFIAILIETASEVKIYDTGLYHAQAIQWINSFPVVPGLGNLHQRFAFNNHSFLLEAFFNFHFLKIQTFHALNGYIAILFTLTIIYYFATTKKVSAKNLFLPIFLIVPFFFYKKFISSTSPDIQVALITCLIFIIYIREDQHLLNYSFWSILILSAYIVTVKQSSFPIALLPIYYILKNIKSLQKKEILLILGIGILFFVPYIIRNIFISGYLVYPFSKIDLFTVDWKVPKEYVDQMTTILKGWGRTKEWSVDKPFAVWFPLWYHKMTIFNKLSVIASFVIPLFFILLQKLKQYKPAIPEKFVVLYYITFIYTAFWLLSVPELRFIFYIQTIIGVLMLINSYQIAELQFSKLFRFNSSQAIKLREKSQRLIASCLLGFIGLIIVFSLKQSLTGNPLVQNLYLPPKYPTVKPIDVIINNTVIKTSSEDQLCWDTCIPCSLIQGKIGINPNIKLRGTKLSDGFMSNEK